MFKLQRLEITGFKSFADYTEILFTGNGITAVVGPNGCGKSNVSDCISWVLGEQRAKSLRGDDMKDVIFQGTSKRKPSGMAEVVLHLIRDEVPYKDDELSDIDEALSEIDEHAIEIGEPEDQPAGGLEVIAAETAFHSEGTGLATALAPVKIKTKRHWRPRNRAFDFAVGEAVSLTRRLYLSGESEYLLNGKACRLRDIQDLFAGTGLSGGHYAIIEQGKIGQILSSKPADRRNLIEEAAGISKFRTRQRAAETRLESAKLNLRRISDIVSEVEKHEASLRRQAAKTKRYTILREEYRELLKNFFAAEGARLSNLSSELEGKLKGANSEEQRIISEVAKKEAEFREATQQARSAEEALGAIKALHAENAMQRDRDQRELIYQNDQTSQLKKRSETLRAEIFSTDQRLRLISDEVRNLKEEEAEQLRASEKESMILREAEEIYQRKTRKLREMEIELEHSRNEVLQYTTAAERFAEMNRQIESNFERLIEKRESLKREGIRADQDYSEYISSLEDQRKMIAGSKEKLKGETEKRESLIEISREAEVALRSAERELKVIQDEFYRIKHRLETLRELEEKKAIYAPSIQKLFSAAKDIGVEFLGTLADRLSVDPQAEKAAELIFGEHLQAVLVKGQAEALKVSRYLSENNLGRISILVTGDAAIIEKPDFKNKERKLLDYLNADKEFESILMRNFPREVSAQIVDSLEDIPPYSTYDFATLNGDICFGGTLFTSGSKAANEKNTSLLAFKRELRELEVSHTKITKEAESALKGVEKLRADLTQKESLINELKQAIEESERNIFSKELQEKTLIQEIERAERHKKVIADEMALIERELSEVESKQSDIRENAKMAEDTRIVVLAKLAAINDQLAAERQEIENENASLGEKRSAAAASAERRRAVTSALRRTESEQKELENRTSTQNLEIFEIEGRLEQLAYSIKELNSAIESAAESKAGEAAELEKASEYLQLSRKAADQLSAELAELNKSSGEAINERAEIEVRRAEAITRLQNLNETCSHELNQSLIQLIENTEIEEGFDLAENRSRVESLREKLDNFGAVNMLALEELAEAEERLSFLTSQRADIIDSIASAEEALREIKERSRGRFREAFEAINKNFGEFFVELFGGGRGEMSLLESEDILEAGIEIVAQPPGKRLQNILLLSGGEKAMTAIALVMAIFQYQPSPFCLLDEVDAPLDEANVGRFVSKIEQMSENTQFIIITHNKRTMEAAKALYGVTMQEAGVSKVVSVRFE